MVHVHGFLIFLNTGDSTNHGFIVCYDFPKRKGYQAYFAILNANVTASDFPFNFFFFYFSLTKGLVAILLSTGFFILSPFTHEYYHDKEREGKTGFSTLKSKKYQNAFSGFFPSFRPTAVSVLLHPSTGDEEDKRFVCLTLLIHLPKKVCNFIV